MTGRDLTDAFITLATVTRQRDELRRELARQRAGNKAGERAAYRRGYLAGYGAGRRKADDTPTLRAAA